MARSSDAPGKRKRETEPAVSNKPALKRKKKAKSNASEDHASGERNGVNEAIGHMDGNLLADHIAQCIKRFEPDLSSVELEDRYVPGNLVLYWLLVVRSGTKDTDSRHYQNAQYTIRRIGVFREPQTTWHSILNITWKGQRLQLSFQALPTRVDVPTLLSSLRKFQSKDSMVAKLFAKHIKLKEAKDMVKRTRIGIGVGTPQRLIDLLDDGALSIEHLERIVVDASHINQKQRGILDMRETEIPLSQLLARKELRSRYNSEQKVDLLFF
ncbi:MAG: hypothetical protein M1821_005277 [Bathelium mastoideum]|nr:MAG: hypothetical protein M1821_005277 [Bathelium mastoideum]KAI9689154.1 MAG: hypothetical protein M1822_000892 [Bathelium mastoideum]